MQTGENVRIIEAIEVAVNENNLVAVNEVKEAAEVCRPEVINGILTRTQGGGATAPPRADIKEGQRLVAQGR